MVSAADQDLSKNGTESVLTASPDADTEPAADSIDLDGAVGGMSQESTTAPTADKEI